MTGVPCRLGWHTRACRWRHLRRLIEISEALGLYDNP